MFGNCNQIIISILAVSFIYRKNFVAGDFNATALCSLVKNETFIRDPTSCTNYFQCIDGINKSISCTDGLYFDKDKQKCVDKKTFNCYYLGMDPCINVAGQKFISDPESCSGYYYCKNGVGSKGSCSSQLNFNPDNNKCVPSTDYQCNFKPFDPNSYCSVIPNGIFFATLDNCKSYLYCNNGTQINGDCPKDYYFNKNNMKCDYRQNVICNDGTDPVIPSNDEKCKTSGTFISDNATCSGYYYCDKNQNDNDFQLYWGKCKTGRFFSEKNGGICVERTQTKCSFDRCDGMGIKQTEQADDPNGKCKSYLICNNGKTIGKDICPDLTPYFDEVKQVCTADIVNYPACAS